MMPSTTAGAKLHRAAEDEDAATHSEHGNLRKKKAETERCLPRRSGAPMGACAGRRQAPPAVRDRVQTA
jgi:hypothetical protein